VIIILEETKIYLKCIRCKRKFPPEIYYRRCPVCSGPLIVELNFDRINITKDQFPVRDRYDIWRYGQLLPISDENKIVSLKEGWTPLIESKRLYKKIGIKHLYLKDETRNPSGSFLDRGVSVDVSIALESGYNSLTCGSTGNLAASVAAYAARAGVRAHIYVPRKIDIGKLYQIAIYGADIYLVNNFEEALRRSEMLFLESYVVSTSNPWYLEGVKTTGLEIAEQFSFELPDYIVLAAGSGAHLVMTYKAFNELKNFDFIDEINTRFIAVQAKNTDPITKAFEMNLDHVEPIYTDKETIASDIAISNPIFGDEVIKIAKKTLGKVISVPDNEIIEALSELAKYEGILAEPSAATSLAGLKRLINEGYILPSEKIVLVVTGAGLKHPKAIRDTVSKVETLKKILSIVEDGFKKLSRLGSTKIRILQAISEGNTYGYAIWKSIKNKFNINIGLPTLYQHLKELERMGFITVISQEVIDGRKSIHYALTGKGRKIVEDFT